MILQKKILEDCQEKKTKLDVIVSKVAPGLRKNSLTEFVDARSITLQTPLHVASKYGQLDMIDFLVENGASVDALDHRKNSSLHYSSAYGNLKATEILLTYKANLKARNDNLQTALHIASKNGHLEIVSLLLEHGAKIDKMDKNKKTANDLAKENGYHEISQKIFDLCSSKKRLDGTTPDATKSDSVYRRFL